MTTRSLPTPQTPTQAPPRRKPGAAERTFLGLLDRHLSTGSIRVIVGGRERSFGAAGVGDAAPALEVHDPRFFRRVLADGNLGLGEAFMDGDWTMAEGEVYELLTVLLQNRLDRKIRGDLATMARMGAIQAGNLLRRRQWRNVQAHYDIGDDLFELFLDPGLTYSCGYALNPSDSSTQLQYNKLDRICRKLELQPGERLLDIGCGYASLLIHAARHYGATGVGITTSRSHSEIGAERVRDAGLQDRVEIRLADHRSMSGGFDKIASVGMLEHLPLEEYRRYFGGIANALPPHGLALIHFIGCNAPRSRHDPFIQKYIFPGSRQPRLSEVAAACEREELAIRDVENLVRHYGYTTMRWLEAFRANRHRLDPARYDDRFNRMWEYYLHCCIAAARASDGALYQVLVMKDYAADMPLHRV
jgi:cyclopropane-fatty-acyl-phospholipid synthase